MQNIIPAERTRTAQTRRVVAALLLTLLPLLALTALSVFQVRNTAENLRASQLQTLQQLAQLAAREFAYELVLAEGDILQRLDLDSPNALAASLATAEASVPGIVCFALLEDGVFLYPPRTEKLATDPALRTLPNLEPLRTLRVIAEQADALLARLGTNDVARVYLPSGRRPVAASLHRLHSGDSAGVIGVCWNRGRFGEWCENVKARSLPATYRIDLTDFSGNRITPPTVPPAPEDSDALDAAVPIPEGAFPLILRLAPAQPARLRLFVRRQVMMHAGILLLLVLFALAGLWFLLAVTTRDAELARMKSSFAAGISHELRTPLALIRAASEALTLRRDMDEERRAHYLGILRREGQRLTDLINTVLTFTRLERRGGIFEPVTNDVAELALAFAEDYRQHAEEKGFTLQTHIPTTPLLARVDAEALRLVLVNLLDNAIKYSPDRKEIALAAAAQDQGIVIHMSDHGIGVEPKDRARIFGSYERGGSELVQQTRGTGLGLALVQRIVLAHGGRIGIADNPGGGATLEIWLPKAVE